VTGEKKRTRKLWSNDEDLYLCELVENRNINKMTYQDIAKKLGRTTQSIKTRVRVLSIEAPKKQYVVYKNDRYVGEGTRNEVAELMGWKPNTVSVYLRRTKENTKNSSIEVFEVDY